MGRTSEQRLELGVAAEWLEGAVYGQGAARLLSRMIEEGSKVRHRGLAVSRGRRRQRERR